MTLGTSIDNATGVQQQGFFTFSATTWAAHDAGFDDRLLHNQHAFAHQSFLPTATFFATFNPFRNAAVLVNMA
jgi:hypothetical protein